MTARRAFMFGSTFVGTCFAALALAAAPVGAFGVSSNPCSLISRTRIEKDLGLPRLKETVVIGKKNSSDGGVVTSACKKIIAWTGSAPTSPQGFAVKVANGTGVDIAIRTFVPDPTATNADRWLSSGFQAKLSATLNACQINNHHPHDHNVSLPRDGAQSSAGNTDAIGHGLSVVCGVWDRSDTHRIVVITGEVSDHSSAVKEFKKIANAAVPRFW